MAKEPMPAHLRAAQNSINCYRSWQGLSPQQRSARTQPARQALEEKFEREVDPEGVLDPAERARRAAVAKRMYFRELALKSAKARARRKGQEPA